MSYGTVPCPEVVSTEMVGGVAQSVICGQTATVEDEGGGSYTSVCPDGHEHAFGAAFLPNVTET